MLVEIEETVRFLASFLINKIPRRRLNHFVELLANSLVERLLRTGNKPVYKFIVNVQGMSDDEIKMASLESQLDDNKLRSFWPKNLIIELKPDSVTAVNAETAARKSIYLIHHHTADNSQEFIGKKSCVKIHPLVKGICTAYNTNELVYQRTQMRVIWANMFDGLACVPKARPYFEVVQPNISCTAQFFASTRFGSTKAKAHQGNDTGCGLHAFTTPSIYSYALLFNYLNSLVAWILSVDNTCSNDSEINQANCKNQEIIESWRMGKSVAEAGDCVARLSPSSPAHLIKRNGNNQKWKTLITL